MDALSLLHAEVFGRAPHAVTPLTQAGSNRAYYRLSANDGTSCIGVVGSNRAENRAFLYLARHFEDKGLPVPHIIAATPDDSCYLQQDLGNLSLYDALAEGRRRGGQFDARQTQWLTATMRLLPHVQIKGAEGLDTNRLLPPTAFDRRTVLFDLHYFKYCFFKVVDAPMPDESALEDDFEHLADNLVACCGEKPSFLYRDFQARNVMLVEDEPYLIDFQSGRHGSLHYDVASFLWQASAGYTPQLRALLLDEYLDEAATLAPIDSGRFRSELRLFVFFRTLQVLGAYGLRGYFERKPHFLQSIPPAIDNLQRQLDEGVAAPYPVLQEALRSLVALPRFSNSHS